MVATMGGHADEKMLGMALGKVARMLNNCLWAHIYGSISLSVELVMLGGSNDITLLQQTT